MSPRSEYTIWGTAQDPSSKKGRKSAEKLYQERIARELEGQQAKLKAQFLEREARRKAAM